MKNLMTPDTGAPENHLSLGEDTGSRSECPGQLREFCSVELNMVGGGDFFFFFPEDEKVEAKSRKWTGSGSAGS